ncbi:MAG: hypothetical protein KIT17_07290 [Rubrivivax sp.]|nr:hypothetical protein [Rubrivivax sp.]
MARQKVIAEMLERHAEDLAFLWGQRREALSSPEHTLREFGELNQRIEAHVQGLLVAPAEALLERCAPALAATDRDEAFAAAYPLLRAARPQTTRAVLAAFAQAAGPALAGLRDALSLAPPALFVADMQASLAQAPPATAVAAAVVLANHRLLEAGSSRLASLVEGDDARVSRLAWRVCASVDGAHHAASGAAAPAPRPYRQGLAHDDVGVRDAAWLAAAWAGHAGVLPLLRQRVAGGDEAALHGLVVLGGNDDAPLVRQAVLAQPEGPRRCELLARFGHPTALNALLRWMEANAPALAAAAGDAFTRITGVDVRGERRTLPVADDADEFTREMAPDVWLPDAKKALAVVERQRDAWAAGTRWRAGLRLDGTPTRETLLQLDLEARWDAAARAALAGQRLSAPPPIH